MFSVFVLLATLVFTGTHAGPSYAASQPSAIAEAATTDDPNVEGAQSGSTAEGDQAQSGGEDSPADRQQSDQPQSGEVIPEVAEDSPAAKQSSDGAQSGRQAARLDAIGPQADDVRDCSLANAGSGDYARILCWLDFGAFTTEYVNTGTSTKPVYEAKIGKAWGLQNPAATNLYKSGSTYYGPITGYPVSFRLSSEYKLTALMDVAIASGDNRGLAIAATTFPTYGNAFLGNAAQNFYTGVTGNPALYMRASGNTTSVDVTLRNIQVKNSSGTAIGGYSIVVADAESTDSGESIAWSKSGTTANFLWLPNNGATWNGVQNTNTTSNNTARKNAAVGNSCGGTSVSAWRSTNPATTPTAPVCTGVGGVSTKTGTAMLKIQAPANGTGFQVRQTMGSSGGLQGVAFGLITAAAEVKVKVDDRIIGSDGAPTASDFSGTFTSSMGTYTASTGNDVTVNSDTTGSVLLPLPDTSSTALTWSSAVNEANATVKNSYMAKWQCQKTSATGTKTYWPSATTYSATAPTTTNTEFVTLLAGEFISCEVTYTPPYLTVTKTVDQANLGAANLPRQWELKGTGAATTFNARSGTKIPVSTGTYILSENGPLKQSASDPVPWTYGYTWSNLVCTPAASVIKDTDIPYGVTSASVTIIKGSGTTNSDSSCTWTNRAVAPFLETSKDVGAVLEGETVTDTDTIFENQSIRYKLVFDNSKGTAAVPVNHFDNLRDVLDDADYVPGSLRYGDNAGAWPTQVTPIVQSGLQVVSGTPNEAITNPAAPGDPGLTISGYVPAGKVRTVSFQVKVKANAVATTDREKNAPGATSPSPTLVGYELNNYLVKTGEAVPTPCPSPRPGPRNCTTNPVLAWKAEKDSQPLSGAALHVGGDLHYKITVKKLNPRAAVPIKNIVVSDDLTQTFQFGHWYPDAPVPYPAQYRGIYIYDAAGNIMQRMPDLGSGNPGNGEKPSQAYKDAADLFVPAPEFTPFDFGPACKPFVSVSNPGPDEPNCFRGTWKLQTSEFTLPADAAYAEVWFSVRAGFDTDPDDQAHIVWSGATPPISNGNWQSYWAPYRQAATSDEFYNVASVDTRDSSSLTKAGQPLSCYTQDGVLSGSPAKILVDSGSQQGMVTIGKPGGVANACMVAQRIDANYFVIRKDLLHRDEQGKLTRDINLIGHEFKLYTDYGGVKTPIEDVPGLMCQNWNQPGSPGISESCARFYVIPEGAQAGRWRAERLPAGTYWLEETKAPTGIRTGPKTETEDPVKPVENAQLLAGQVKFVVQPSSQLDVPAVGGGFLPRCTIPYGGDVSSLPTACINPTGYVMVLTDVAPTPLPLTGGDTRWFIGLTAGGSALLAGALAGTIWWRRRQRIEETESEAQRA